MKFLICLMLLISYGASADAGLKKIFSKSYKSKSERSILEDYALKLGGKAVPSLIEVMKTSSYPDDNRWMATYLLGQIMGEKSAPFIAKFLRHPKWFMRLASLKTLLILKQSSYKQDYARALKDPSLIVRAQAVDNIIAMKIKELAPSIWNMLYDESNYAGARKNLKRTQMVKDAILAVGHLDFQEAKQPMLKMISNNRYSDLVSELDYSLTRLTGKVSPKHRGAKQIFWTKFAISEQVIR